MEEYTGIIEMKVEGKQISIPYVMNNLAGNPHVYFMDKNGRHHGFSYRHSDGMWLYQQLRSPLWPTEFTQKLFHECNKARVRHGL